MTDVKAIFEAEVARLKSLQPKKEIPLSKWETIKISIPGVVLTIVGAVAAAFAAGYATGTPSPAYQSTYRTGTKFEGRWKRGSL